MGKNKVRIEQEEKNEDFSSDVTFPTPFIKKIVLFFFEILNFFMRPGWRHARWDANL